MPASGRRKCERCSERPVAVPRPRDGTRLCKQCFCEVFEDEVHATIMRHGMFHRGQRLALAASGGKDSTVLIHVMKRLNDRYDYGLNMFLLSVDEGITGYRDDSLETVKRNSSVYGLELRVVSYAELYDGWTMDRVVRRTGLKSNCTYCGVFRRSALERGARVAGADLVATGHNADDVAETVLMNLLRGDTARLSRCVDPITAGDAPTASSGSSPPSPASALSAVPRCKPLVGAYEKEIVLYAFHNRLDYFSTECVYSPNAYRGFAREYVKAIEAARPSSILDTIRAGEALAPLFGQGGRAGAARDAVARAATGAGGAAAAAAGADAAPGAPAADEAAGGEGAAASAPRRGKGKGRKSRKPKPITACERCGLMTSQRFCQACSLLESLEAGGGAHTVDASLPLGAVVIGYEADGAAAGRPEGARLVPESAPVVAVRGGTGVRGGPDEVLRLSGVPAGGDLRSVSWHKGDAVRVTGTL